MGSFRYNRGEFRHFRKKGHKTSEAGILEYYGEQNGQHKFHIIFMGRKPEQILNRARELYEQARVA